MVRNTKVFTAVIIMLLLLQLASNGLSGGLNTAQAAPGGPNLLGTYPADNAANIPAGASLTLTFDENVVRGTGSAAVTIRRVSDNALVESFVSATSSRLSINSINRNIVTVTPSSGTLEAGVGYYVLIDAGAFRNDGGANFQGISSATAWNFSVVPADTTAPVVTARVPAQGTTVPMGSELQLTFNKNVFASSGSITIQNTGSNDIQVISVVSYGVRGSGTNTITITPPTPLQPSSSYSVAVTGGAFQDTYGNNSAAMSGWTFQTNAPPMNMPSFSPTDDAAGVNPSAPLTMAFDSNVSKGTGSIFIKRLSNNSTFQTIDVISPAVTITGNAVTFSHNNLEANTSYYVLADTGAFVSASDPAVRFQGITDASSWNFTTLPGADTTAPAATGFKPADNGLMNTLSSNLEITFNEPVYPGSGSIVIKNSANDLVFANIPVTSSQVVGGGTSRITIDPGLQFVNNNSYYVQIGSQAFRDYAGNNFAGIPQNNKTAWNFTVTQDTTLPVITALSPANNANAVALDSVFTATFSETVEAGPGTVQLRRANALPVGGSLTVDPDNNRKVNITFPAGALVGNTAYYIEMEQGTVRDQAGNEFVGILNEHQWTFRTIGSDITAPQLSKAELSSGTKIVLTYNEPLDVNSVPAAANFYATVSDAARAVTAVEVGGSTVTLTLQSGVLYGQAVKLSYSKGSSPIQDLSGNAALNVTAYSVTTSPDAALPKPVSGSVSGSLVTLSFNETLSSMNSAGYSQFSVYVGGSYHSVNSVTVGGSVVLLTISNPVTDGQTVSVSYAPGAYPLRDQSGNAAQAFSSFYVANSLDVQAPILQSIIVSGTKVILSYNEGLNQSSVPLVNQFAVLVDNTSRTISTVEVSGSQVILTLSSTVATGQSVLVSFFAGAPALTDLASNGAVSYSNQSAGIVTGTGSGSVAGSVQLAGATVQGQTMTLTFGQQLNSAYVPAASAFYIKIDGSFHTVSTLSLSGATVTLQLSRTVAAGESASVSYLSSGTQLRTVSGQTITAFTDALVTNLASWAGTLPADLELSGLGGLNLKTSGASASSDVTPAGKSGKRYTLSADKVLVAYNTLKSGASTAPRLQFTVPDTESAAIVAVPVRQLEDAQKGVSNASFAVKYKDYTYEIPLNYLDYAELGQMAGTGVTSGHLLIKIDTDSSNSTSLLMDAISRVKAQVMTTPVYYQVSFTNGSSEKPVNGFKGYVSRTVKSPVQLDARKTAVVWLDPETNQLSYVPTKVQTSDGVSTVTFKRKGNSPYAIVYGSASYEDVDGHWAKNDMLLLSRNFISEGRTTAKYEPNKPITRGEFAMFIARGLGLSGNKQAAAKFKDVNISTTMAAYIGAASEAGIVLGNTDGTFKPNNSITRQEMAVMMVRAASSAGVKIQLTKTASFYYSKFKDKGYLASWAQQDMAKAIDIGVIGGTAADLLGPTSDATRAQATVMMKRLLVYLDFLDV